MASNIWLLCLEHPAILLYILSFCSFFETYFKYILIHDAFLSPKSSRQSSAHLVCALIVSYALVLINIALTKSYCSSPHSKLWTPWGRNCVSCWSLCLQYLKQCLAYSRDSVHVYWVNELIFTHFFPPTHHSQYLRGKGRQKRIGKE